MATYELETDDGSVYQVDTEEPIASTPRTGIQTAGDIIGGLTNPLISKEQVMGSKLGQFMAQASPMSQFQGIPIPPPFSQMIPPAIRTPMNAEMISQQTSPMAIASNAMVGLGALKSSGMLPQLMGKGYTLARATKATQAIDELRTTLGEAKKQAVGAVADKVVPNFKPTMPQQILNKLQDPLYEIEFTQSGAIKPTIGNLDKVKDALGDLMTSRGWEEATKKLQQSVKMTYGYVKDAMVGADDSIKEPIKAYSDFMGKYGLVNKSLRDTSGNILEKKIRTAFTKGSEEQTKIAWKELSKQSEGLKQVMKDMGKWASRQEIKKIAAPIGGIGLLGYMAHRYLTDKLMGNR
jgi:hypothetical protein